MFFTLWEAINLKPIMRTNLNSRSSLIGTVLAQLTVPIRFADANSLPSQDLLTGKG